MTDQPTNEQPTNDEPTKLDWSYRTVAQRAELGRAARKQTPRTAHAQLPAADRDPVELLQSQALTRVPELIPIRYGRMLASPFTFYRGAALLMAHDLSQTPDSDITVQLCGDAHLSNFGVFGSPERELMFDVNDFDETLPGPWEWDLKRLATSVLIASRDNGLDEKAGRTATLAAARRYREAMRDFAARTNLGVWYAHIAIEELLNSHLAQDIGGRYKQATKSIAKARSRDSSTAFSKLTTVLDGQPRIKPQPPIVMPYDTLFPGVAAEDLYADLAAQIDSYRASLEDDKRELIEQYKLVDFARRIVGVGSVGTRCWIALLLGRDDQDPLFLQIKQAEPSVLERFVGPSQYEHHGQRVVNGQRLMQAASDILLGWVRYEGLTTSGGSFDYYIRQFRDWKGSVDIPGLDARGLAAYAELCGWTLARAHARSGDRIAIAAYLGSGDVFDRAIYDFAEAYAERNDSDYKALKKAAKSGRIAVQYGE